MSKRYAVVEGGKVKNIIDADNEEYIQGIRSNHDAVVDISLLPDAVIGGDYDGVVFIPPAVPTVAAALSTAQADRTALVRVEAMQRIEALAYDSAEAFDIDMINQDTKEQEKMAQTRQDIRDAAAVAVSDIAGLTVEGDVDGFTW